MMGCKKALVEADGDVESPDGGEAGSVARMARGIASAEHAGGSGGATARKEAAMARQPRSRNSSFFE